MPGRRRPGPRRLGSGPFSLGLPAGEDMVYGTEGWEDYRAAWEWPSVLLALAGERAMGEDRNIDDMELSVARDAALPAAAPAWLIDRHLDRRRRVPIAPLVGVPAPQRPFMWRLYAELRVCAPLELLPLAPRRYCVVARIPLLRGDFVCVYGREAGPPAGPLPRDAPACVLADRQGVVQLTAVPLSETPAALVRRSSTHPNVRLICPDHTEALSFFVVLAGIEEGEELLCDYGPGNGHIPKVSLASTPCHDRQIRSCATSSCAAYSVPGGF